MGKGFTHALKALRRSTGLAATTPYDKPGSYQKLGIDLTVDPNAGSFDTSDSDYIAPIMGNIMLRDDLAEFSSTFTAADTNDLFTVTAHGLETGDGPFEFIAGSGALPTGVSASTPYWIIKVSANTFQVASSKANAIAGTKVTISDAGTPHATRLFEKIISRMPGTGNYLAGLIGKYNVPGEVDSKYPTGGVIGEIGEEIVGDLTAKPDGCVVAVVGGDSQAVSPRAYFARRHLNSNPGSGPQYGMDLYDPHAAGLSYQQGAPSVADLRFSNQQLFVALDTAITANTTTTSAPAGSIAVTSHATGVGKLFMSDGSKWQFAVVA